MKVWDIFKTNDNTILELFLVQSGTFYISLCHGWILTLGVAPCDCQLIETPLWPMGAEGQWQAGHGNFKINKLVFFILIIIIITLPFSVFSCRCTYLGVQTLGFCLCETPRINYDCKGHSTSALVHISFTFTPVRLIP